ESCLLQDRELAGPSGPYFWIPTKALQRRIRFGRSHKVSCAPGSNRHICDRILSNRRFGALRWNSSRSWSVIGAASAGLWLSGRKRLGSWATAANATVFCEGKLARVKRRRRNRSRGCSLLAPTSVNEAA